MGDIFFPRPPHPPPASRLRVAWDAENFIIKDPKRTDQVRLKPGQQDRKSVGLARG